MLTTREIEIARHKYDDSKSHYETASDYFVNTCRGFKKNSDIAFASVRLVFSREPKVKTFESIIKKINTKRRKRPKYSYDDLEDMIALTVLCPYPSDAQAFIGWMRRAFEVKPEDVTGGPRKDPSGHRGYHCVVSAKRQTATNLPYLKNVKCEFQVKTILEEAFDAKTHDLTYKPTVKQINPELVKQFAVLSGALEAIDGQSEFLKTLILE